MAGARKPLWKSISLKSGRSRETLAHRRWFLSGGEPYPYHLSWLHFSPTRASQETILSFSARQSAQRKPETYEEQHQMPRAGLSRRSMRTSYIRGPTPKARFMRSPARSSTEAFHPPGRHQLTHLSPFILRPAWLEVDILSSTGTARPAIRPSSSSQTRSAAFGGPANPFGRPFFLDPLSATSGQLFALTGSRNSGVWFEARCGAAQTG